MDLIYRNLNRTKPIDNNMVENAVRPFVIGRKNYLLHGSPAGADASAALYSIIETAKANGHEPFFYLYYLFSKLPHATDAAAIAALLPFNLERKEVHDFAAANWLGLGS
jgi:transposase